MTTTERERTELNGHHEGYVPDDDGLINPLRMIGAGAFIYDAPERVPAVWGRDDDVLWSEGEPLMITGPTGVGKTTLGGQLIAGRMALLDEVLGYPVIAGERTLYLAMDRPPQISRALARQLRRHPRDQLDKRMTVWRGPPPQDIGRHPEILARLARQADADTIVIDSLKDAALKLSDEETGQGVNRAMQLCCAYGIQVLVYHHQTKRGDGKGGKPNTIADVYGSMHLTAGCGSVILLWGAAGDPVIELSHLKPPAASVGPMKLLHDFTTGEMSVYHDFDLLALLLTGPQSARAVAAAWFSESKPDKSQIEKARRRLDKMVADGLAVKVSDQENGGFLYGAARRG